LVADDGIVVGLMNIKVKGVTARSDGAALCVECRWAKVMRGDRGQEHTECGQLDAQVTFKVVSCSEFVSRQHPSLWHMEDIAWILRTDNRKRQVGFIRGRDLRASERLGFDD
jgi:hypothetical protein